MRQNVCNSVVFVSISAALLSGCVGAGAKNDIVAITGSAARKLNLTPVYPLTSDLQPGDIFMLLVVKDNKTKTCLIPDDKKPSLSRRVLRVNAANLAKALDEDSLQRLDSEIIDNTKSTRVNKQKYSYPVVSFPAFSYSELLGASAGLTTGVLGAGFNSQKNESFDVSFDEVVSIGLPSYDFANLVYTDKIKETLGNTVNTTRVISSMVAEIGNPNCKVGDFDHKFVTINNIYAAKTIKIVFGNGSSFSAEFKSYLTGLMNYAKKVPDGASLPNIAVVDGAAKVADAAGKDANAANKDVVTANGASSSITSALAAINTLVDSKTPGVTSSFGIAESGAVSINNKYPYALAFGVGQIYYLDPSDWLLASKDTSTPIGTIGTASHLRTNLSTEQIERIKKILDPEDNTK